MATIRKLRAYPALETDEKICKQLSTWYFGNADNWQIINKCLELYFAYAIEEIRLGRVVSLGKKMSVKKGKIFINEGLEQVGYWDIIN